MICNFDPFYINKYFLPFAARIFSWTEAFSLHFDRKISEDFLRKGDFFSKMYCLDDDEGTKQNLILYL